MDWHISVDAVGGESRVWCVPMGDAPEPHQTSGDDLLRRIVAVGISEVVCVWVARHARLHWAPRWHGRIAVATAYITGTDADVDGVSVSVLAHIDHRTHEVVCGDSAPMALAMVDGDGEVDVDVSEWAVLWAAR